MASGAFVPPRLLSSTDGLDLDLDMDVGVDVDVNEVPVTLLWQDALGADGSGPDSHEKCFPAWMEDLTLGPLPDLDEPESSVYLGGSGRHSLNIYSDFSENELSRSPSLASSSHFGYDSSVLSPAEYHGGLVFMEPPSDLFYCAADHQPVMPCEMQLLGDVGIDLWAADPKQLLPPSSLSFPPPPPPLPPLSSSSSSSSFFPPLQETGLASSARNIDVAQESKPSTEWAGTSAISELPPHPPARHATTTKRLSKVEGCSAAERHRVQKRTPRRSNSATSTQPAPKAANINEDDDSEANKGHRLKAGLFICSFARYGCASTFGSKNEWKRHIASQHLQLGFYRCDLGRCNTAGHHLEHPSDNVEPHTDSMLAQTTTHKPAISSTHFSPSSSSFPPSFPLSIKSHSDASTGQEAEATARQSIFNRKDLFTQHLRRMHAPWLQRGARHGSPEEEVAFEQQLGDVCARCLQSQRQPPPQSQCGFCDEKFTNWDARMDHVGRHFEIGGAVKRHIETEDLALRQWAVDEGIILWMSQSNGQGDGQGKWRLASTLKGKK